MSYRYALTFFLTVVSIHSFSQSPGIQWQRTLPNAYQEGLANVLTTNDNNLMVYSNRTLKAPGSAYDLRLTKLNPQGQIIWERGYGGSRADYVREMYKLPDGSFIL